MVGIWRFQFGTVVLVVQFVLILCFALLAEYVDADGSAAKHLTKMYPRTVFLWLYWPSLNGGGVDGDEQHRDYVNTYLYLCGCTLATFAFSAIYNKKGKFSADHIQNATLAGGVAVGTTATMPLEPWGALLMGCVSGFVSITGFRFIQAFIEKKLRIHDTCGVHNLHGMPGVLAAIAGAIVAGMINFDDWSIRYRIAALVLTVALTIWGGELTGFALRLPVLNNIDDGSDLFDDGLFWNVADDMPTMDGDDGYSA